MVRNRKSKLFITITILIAILIGVYYSSLAKGADTLTITYTSEGESNIVTTTTPDQDLDSILLLNFGEGGTASWTHDTISGTYTDASSTTKTANYEAAFAGWKLVSINGNSVVKEYIYPDNDFIYFEDKPFDSYSTVTSVVLEAVWGKKVYVRDPYNFVNIQDVYGVNDVDGIGNVETAKFNWDTSTVFSADTNSGATSNTPVSTLRQAYNLLKNSYGGKIQIVNHVTLEGPAGEGFNAYESNYEDKNNYSYELGKNLNISGVVTLTGKSTGSGKTVENKSADTAATYANGYLYIKNTNGAGTYGTKSAYTKVPTNKIYFYCNTVLEGLNSIAHRECYNINQVRLTADEYFYNTPDNRFLIENDFYGYKRSTSQAQYGYDTTNWSHSKVAGEDKNGTIVTYNALSNGFGGVTHLSMGAKNYGDFTGDGNYYMNIRGGTSWYGIYGCEVGTNYMVNNIHLNVENVSPGDVKPIGSALNCNNVTVRTNDVTLGSSFIGATNGSTVNANKIKYVIDGTSSKKINNLYAGAYRASVSESIITTKADIDVILRGNAKITNLYGGGNNISLLNLGTINIEVRNGTVDNIYGGGQGGFVGNESSPAIININTTGGTIGNIYGAGAGGFVELSASNSPRNISEYVISEKYAYNSSDKYYLSRDKNSDEYMYDIMPLTLNGSTYQTVWRRGIYPEGSDKTNYKSYYNSTYRWVVSDALVTADININVGGTTKVTGNIYGGGKNGALTGNIEIKISDGVTVAKNIYAGGEGLNSTIDSKMDFNFKWTGVMADDVLTLDKLELMANTAGSAFKSAPSAGNYTSPFVIGSELKGSKYYHDDGYVYIYTDAIAKFGAINGNTSIEINNANLKNSVVYAGSNGSIAKVIGDAKATVNGSTIKGLYGGGNAGIVDGKTNININDTTVNGDIFGAGNIADVTGNVTLTMTGTNTVAGNIYGGSNEGTANGVVATIEGTAIGGNVYAGGNMGNITTSAKLTLSNSSAKNIYGGGYSGIIVGNTNLTLTDVTATEVFGGGYAGNVDGTTTLTVNSGIYERVFGGCDQAVVNGGTTTKVGSLSNPVVVISDILYGGGRGVDSDGDGDASDFLTVGGHATVDIEGMNTRIENYGSTKLGSVGGEVNVTFNTYRNDNSTKPYITMNGIDRATNVYLINSYIALENMTADGIKEGIKNIHNLHVPAGSGLKVTADSEITGDFNGGGYFYLDSEVTLTVGGNITGKTILVINPQLADGSESNVDSALVIRGGIENAYLVVKGTSSEGNIICSDARYSSRQQYSYTTYNSVTAGYFYIDADVGIDEQIDSLLKSVYGVKYTENDDAWSNDTVQIYQDSTFTTNIELTYNFAVANGDEGSYRNIARSIILKESDITGTAKNFPVGTQITMIVKSGDSEIEYYKYSVSSATDRIYISDFVLMEDDSPYQEVTNLVDDANTSIEGSTASSNIYARTEEFRFVVDFNYCDTYVPKNTYILYMDVQNDNVSSSALSNNAINVIDIRDARIYDITISNTGTNYEERSIIPTDVTINIGAGELAGKDRLVGLPLYALVTVKDPSGNYAKLPENTVVTLGEISKILSGDARFELFEITENAHEENLTINVDMSNCEPYQIQSGIYTFEYSIYVHDATPEKILAHETYQIMLNRLEDNYSVNNLFFITLKDALDYIRDNTLTTATIKTELNDDAVSNEIIPAGYNITLDLNGKKIVGSVASSSLLTNNGNLHITDGLGGGRITVTGNNATTYMIDNNNTLKITSGDFVANGSTSIKGVIGSSSGTVTIENAKIYANNDAIDLNTGSTNLTVQGTTISSNTNAIDVNGGSSNTVLLKGNNQMTTTGNCINITVGSDVNVLDGKYISTGGNALEHTSTGTITLGNDDGNVSEELPMLQGTTYGVNTNTTLNHYDGIVVANAENPISKTPDRIPVYYKSKVKEENSKYIEYLENIQNCYWVATKEYYESVQDAINDIVANGYTSAEIRIVKNYNDANTLWSVPSGYDIVLNVNGYELTKPEGVEIIGNLEISGPGEITSTNVYTIKNKGSLTLSDVTISNKASSTTNKTQAIINEASATLNINLSNVYCKPGSSSTMAASAITDNGGTITVNEGEIELEVATSQTSDIYNVVELTNGSSVFNLQDGKISAVNSKKNINGVKILNGGKLVLGTSGSGVSITNPVIESDGVGVVNTDSSFVIYDGIIKGKTSAYTGSVTDVETGYELFESESDGYKTVSLTNDITPPIKEIEIYDDVSKYAYSGAKVTISDNDIVDDSTLKYLWTTRSTGVTEAELTESFENGGVIYAPYGVVGNYYLWIVAKDITGNTVFGTDGHCFVLENPHLEVGKKENANGKSELFILALNAQNKYKNYVPTASNGGTVTSAVSAHPTGTAWQLDKTGSAMQKHSLSGVYGNEFSGLSADTYVVIASDYTTSNAAGQTEFEGNELRYMTAYGKQYSTETVISNIDIVADSNVHHASEVLLLKENTDSTGVMATSALPNWKTSNGKGTMIVDKIQWLTVPASDISNGVALVKWAYGEKNVGYFETAGNVIENGSSVPAVKTGKYTVYMKTTEGREIIRVIEVDSIEADKLMATEWSIPTAANRTVKLPISGAINAVVDWGDGNVDYVSSEYPSHTYESAGTYQVVVGGNVESWGSTYNASYVISGTSNDYAYTQYLTKVKQWGEIGATKYSFAHCSKLNSVSSDISSTTVNAITDCSYMFAGCEALTEINFSKWNTTNVTNMNGMFENCTKLVQLDLAKFNTANVTSMNSMFENAKSLTLLNLGSEFDKLSGNKMFSGDNALTTIITIKPVTSSADAVALGNATGLNTLTNAIIYVLDESAYESATNYSTVFGAGRIKPLLEVKGEKFIVVDLGTLYDETVDEGALFAGFDKNNAVTYVLLGYAVETAGLAVNTTASGTHTVTYTAKYNDTTLMTAQRTIKSVDANKLMPRESYDDINGTEVYYAIGASRANKKTYKAELIRTITILGDKTVPADALDSWDASLYSGDEQIFVWVKRSLEDSSMYDMYIGGDKAVIPPANSSNLFGYYTNCVSITGTNVLNVTDVTDMSKFFYGNEYLTTIDEGISSWSVSKVTDMSYLFTNCSRLTTLNLNSWNTSAVQNFKEMFNKCSSIVTLTMPNLNMNSATNLSYMFADCTNLVTLTIPVLSPTKVTTTDSMFYNCANIESLNLSSWGTTKLKDTDNMFEGMEKLKTLNLSNWNPTALTTAVAMFKDCSILESIDVKNWTTGSLTMTTDMFRDCAAITVLDLTSWNTSSIQDMSGMFTDCGKLETLLLGKNVTKLDGTATNGDSGLFVRCNNLKTIIAEKNAMTSGDVVKLSDNTGLSDLGEITLYVPNVLAERSYEEKSEYVSLFTTDRIKPILELVGEPNITIRPNDPYTEEKYTVFGTTNSELYQSLGYTVMTEGSINNTESGRYTIVYTLCKPDDTEIMSVSRSVYVRFIPSAPIITVTQDTYNNITSGSWANGDLVVTIGGSAYLGGDIEYMYSLDGENYEVGNTFDFTEETLSQMIYAKARGIVESGDVSSVTTFEIKLDKTAPKITNHIEAGYEDVLAVIDLEIDDGSISSGIAQSAIYSSDNLGVVTWQDGTKLTLPDDGIWYVWAKDTAGNISDVYSFEANNKLKVEAVYGAETKKFINLAYAINELEDQGIINASFKLLDHNDSDLGELTTPLDSEYTLDMNGKVIQLDGKPFDINGKFTIRNSSDELGGIVRKDSIESATGADDKMILTVNGELIIDGNVQIGMGNMNDIATFDMDYTTYDFIAVNVSNGSFKLLDGTIINMKSYPAIRNNGVTTILGGTVGNATASAIANNGNLTISDDATVVSTSDSLPTIMNNGVLTLGASNINVYTDKPLIEGNYKVIENANTLNFYDGRLVANNNTVTLDGFVTNFQQDYHLVEKVTGTLNEMYLVPNTELVERWDISATSEDNVIAAIYVVEGDGISDNTKYKLIVSGSGATKGFTHSWSGSYGGYLGTQPWFENYVKDIIEIKVEEGVTKLGEEVFWKLENVSTMELPDSLEIIDAKAFTYMYGLSTNVHIPKNVSDISSNNPFQFTGITSFSVSTENTTFEVKNEGLYNKNTKTLYTYPCGSSTTNAIIADGTHIIRENAFVGNKNAKTVSIPSSLTTISSGGFARMEALEEITIPETVKIIRGSSFNYNSKLKYVYLKPTSFDVFTNNGTFYEIGENSIIYTESKEIADMFEADNTYTYVKTKVYYPFKIVNPLENQAIARDATLTIEPEIRAGYIASDVSYQWYKNGIAIDGATTDTFVKTDFTDTDAAIYKLVIKSAMQENEEYYYTVETNECTVTLGDFEPPESITLSPSYNADGSVTLTITAYDKESGVDIIKVNDSAITITKNDETGSAVGTLLVDQVGTYVITATDYFDNTSSVDTASYEITYSSNSAECTGETIHQIKIKGNPIELRNCGYEKTGHAFTGWNTKADGTGDTYEESATYGEDSSIDLYATWQILSYTVRFYNDNGIDGNQIITEDEYVYGTSIVVPGIQYRTTTEFNGDTYRIFFHENNWTAEKVDSNAKEDPVNITSANQNSIVMIDSDVNYYASYTYVDKSKDTTTVKLDGDMEVVGQEYGIYNLEGLVILGESSSSTEKPTITGNIALYNDNGAILWYNAGFSGPVPVQGLIVEK